MWLAGPRRLDGRLLREAWSLPPPSRASAAILLKGRQALTDHRVSLRRQTTSSFAASVISSVIALAKPENRSEQTKADEKIRKR
jgi:hypothetical protein